MLKKRTLHITPALMLLLLSISPALIAGPEENEMEMSGTDSVLFFEGKTNQEMRDEIKKRREEREKKEAAKKAALVNWQNDGQGDNWNGLKNGPRNVPAAGKRWPGIYGYGMTPALNLGFTFPGFAYGKRYKSVPGYSLGTRLERYERFGLVPDAVFRYTELESRDRAGKVDSSLSLSQFSVGARYNYKVKLPDFLSRYDFFRRPVTLYVRASEGITRVAFTSDQVTSPIVEYINTIELSTGFVYPVYNFVEGGVDFGYRYIATKDVPLQAFYLMLVFGVRV